MQDALLFVIALDVQSLLALVLVRFGIHKLLDGQTAIALEPAS